MALYQFDWLKSMPYSPNPSGRYYWTNVMYLESTDFPNVPQMINHALSKEKIICRANINVEGYRLKTPPGRGNVVSTVDFSILQPGGQPAIANPYLLTIARWTLIDDLGRKSYRLVRYPLGEADIIDGKLSPLAMTRQQASLGTYLITGTMRNSYGRVLTTGSVSPLAHMWQLRHGTKRGRSKFWLP